MSTERTRRRLFEGIVDIFRPKEVETPATEAPPDERERLLHCLGRGRDRLFVVEFI